MKIIKSLLFTICVLSYTNALAIDVTIDNISYSLNIGTRTAAVSGSTLENVVVPEIIYYDDVKYAVTSVTQKAFCNNSTIKSFKSSSIIEIQGYEDSNGRYNGNTGSEVLAEGAFAEASNLEEVHMENIEKISAAAFYNDTKLKKINVGKSLKQISSIAFSHCSSLKYIVIPASITKIDITNNWSWYGNSAAFASCPQLVIICLKDGFTCVRKSSSEDQPQAVYPSSFYTFESNIFNYNGNNPTINFSFNGIGFGFKPTTAEMEGLKATAGTHTSNLHCVFTNSDMSFEVDIPYNYTINPITLKAKVVDVSREYGDANPEFSSSYTGFVNNEDASVLTSHGNYLTSASKWSDVGTYVIKQTGAKAQNYVFEYEDGKLTVNKAPLTMTANNKSITYGNKLPTFDVTYAGLKNNEKEPKWNKTLTISSTATDDSDAGTYPIEINEADATNYTLTTENGTLTINKAALTIKAINKNKLYGETNPELTCSYVGFVKNQTDAVLSTKPQLSTTATTNSTVGIYPIEVSSAEATNYSISYQNAELTINKRELSVTANNYTRAYGEENPEFELTYKGFVNNEDENVLKVKPTATTSATSTSDVGEYSIIVENGVAVNYNFLYINGKLTIEKAYQTLSWDQDFSDVKVHNLIELTAEASSGLEITYSVEGGQSGRIRNEGGKQYLDCIDIGEVVIVAIQKGNKNYRESNKIYKTIVINGSENSINGHEYVDLGLASGKLWAKTNYGSNTAEGNGTYLDWGSKDLISSQWGSEWTTPSLEDIRELENSCSWTWDSMNGQYGYLVKGNNGNSIFLPACGYKMTGQSSAKKVGEWVYYWSSAKNGEMASIMMCTSSNVWYGEMNVSYTKLPIRPVAKGTSSDLRGIKLSSNDNSQDNIYDMKGQKQNGLKKGINIIKCKDGSTKKIVVR